jgi:hypothetical protein
LDARVEALQLLIPLGLQAVTDELQQAVVELAGPRYQRKAADLPLRRWGSQLGSVYLALLLDGKSFADEQIIIALGVTLDGQKIPLGFVQTATENERVCRRFLGDLVDRGLQYEKGHACVLRCQYHKRKNVESYLPKSEQSRIRR